MTTFVANPCVPVQRRLLITPCLRASKRHDFLRRTPCASIMSSDSKLPESTRMRHNSDVVADVADNDPVIEEQSLNVVNVLADTDVASQRRKRVRRTIGQLVHEIDFPPETFLTSDADRQPPIQDDETAKYIRTAVKAADKRKAEHIVAMRISKLTYIASFIVIATGSNAPQLRAIANVVEQDLGKHHGLPPRRIDGVPNSGWILLDYGDFLVNIFSPEQRTYYDLESLWRKAEKMDISDCIVEQPQEPDIVSSDVSLDDWLSE